MNLDEEKGFIRGIATVLQNRRKVFRVRDIEAEIPENMKSAFSPYRIRRLLQLSGVTKITTSGVRTGNTEYAYKEVIND